MFLDDVCEHELTVGQAFNRARVTLFPLSLLYSCFANPELKILA
jgi:hypothetical protein